MNALRSLGSADRTVSTPGAPTNVPVEVDGPLGKTAGMSGLDYFQNDSYDHDIIVFGTELAETLTSALRSRTDTCALETV